MGRSNSREPSAWRIVFGVNGTTPVSSILVTTSRVLALSLKGFSIVPVRLTRAAAAATMVQRGFWWCRWSSNCLGGRE